MLLGVGLVVLLSDCTAPITFDTLVSTSIPDGNTDDSDEAAVNAEDDWADDGGVG